MIRDNRETTWPFFCALFCLFVLSITAPQIWQRSIQFWPDGISAIDGIGSADSPWGGWTISTWWEEPKGDRDLAAAFVSERVAGLRSETDLQTAISLIGEMQFATPGPKYGRQIVDSDLADLGLPGPIESSEQLDQAEKLADDNPQIGLAEDNPQIGLTEENPQISLTEDNPQIGLLEGIALLPPEENPEMEPAEDISVVPPDDNRDMSLVEGVAVVLPEQISSLGPPSDKPGGWSAGSPGWPEELLNQLDELSWNCETGQWARSTAGQVRRLGQAMGRGTDEAASSVRILDDLALGADGLADRLGDDLLASRVRQAARSLGRRTILWQWVIAAGGPKATIGDRRSGDVERFGRCLVRIDEMLGDSAESPAWREFLTLEGLNAMAAREDAGSSEEDWTLFIEVLSRLNHPGLTEEQHQFVSGGPIADLRSELRDLVGGPVNLGGLLEHVERYESSGSVGDARRLSQDLIRLQVSPVADNREFGERLQRAYREPNVRITVTQELLNRMIPAREEEYELVQDRVMDLPVRGHQWTDTDVAILMVPDARRLCMALKIDGLVSTLTSSSSGPATFYNDSESTYTAYKEMELKTSGLHFQPARVSVDNVTYLRSVETDLDGIPLIGSLLREYARSEHQRNRSQISREVKQKVLRRAKRQIDEESESRLGALGDRLTDRVVEPLNAMSIGPTMVEAQTSQERMTMKLRLAGNMHLGAHTDRPWAMSDSLASCQIHESALNNIVAGLELDGKTYTLAELGRHVADKFNRPQPTAIQSENDDVSITFARSEAARIRFEDGRISIRLSVAELRQSRRAWTNFQVLAFYRPQVNGRSVELVRDGVVQLVGRYSFRSQIALRAIFSKTFSKEHPWQVLPESLAADPSLDGLCVTQLTFADGWLAFALGPENSLARRSLAQRTASPAE